MESKFSRSWRSTQGQFLLVIILIVFSVIIGFVCSPDEIVGIAWKFTALEASEVSISFFVRTPLDSLKTFSLQC